MNIGIAILTVILMYMLIIYGKELIQTATMLPTTTTMLPTTTTMLPTTTTMVPTTTTMVPTTTTMVPTTTTMLPTTTTMVPTTTTMVPTTTTMLPTTTTMIPTTTTMLPTTTTMIPTTTTITTQPVSEYYNIINNPSREQVVNYASIYLNPGDYRIGQELIFNIDENISPILTKNNTVIEYKTNQNSGGFGYFSSIYLKLFIDPRVLKSNINYTLLKTIIISKLVFNVTIDQRFTDITGYVVFNVQSIGTTTQN